MALPCIRVEIVVDLLLAKFSQKANGVYGPWTDIFLSGERAKSRHLVPHARFNDDYVSRLNFAPPTPSLPVRLFSSRDAPSCKSLQSSIRKYRENGKIFDSSKLIAFDGRWVLNLRRRRMTCCLRKIEGRSRFCWIVRRSWTVLICLWFRRFCRG